MDQLSRHRHEGNPGNNHVYTPICCCLQTCLLLFVVCVCAGGADSVDKETDSSRDEQNLQV